MNIIVKTLLFGSVDPEGMSVEGHLTHLPTRTRQFLTSVAMYTQRKRPLPCKHLDENPDP